MLPLCFDKSLKRQKKLKKLYKFHAKCLKNKFKVSQHLQNINDIRKKIVSRGTWYMVHGTKTEQQLPKLPQTSSTIKNTLALSILTRGVLTAAGWWQRDTPDARSQSQCVAFGTHLEVPSRDQPASQPDQCCP